MSGFLERKLVSFRALENGIRQWAAGWDSDRVFHVRSQNESQLERKHQVRVGFLNATGWFVFGFAAFDPAIANIFRNLPKSDRYFKHLPVNRHYHRAIWCVSPERAPTVLAQLRSHPHDIQVILEANQLVPPALARGLDLSDGNQVC